MTLVALERIYHPWTTWECFRSGFFTPTGSAETLAQWRAQYVELLSDLKRFRAAMDRVVEEWPFSTEHNLTNESMNRVAWLGQSSCCIEFGACAEQTRSAFNTMPKRRRDAANAAAQKKLDEWIRLFKLFSEIRTA